MMKILNKSIRPGKVLPVQMEDPENGILENNSLSNKTAPTAAATHSSELQKASEIMNQGDGHLSYYQSIVKPQLTYIFDIQNKEIDSQFAKYNFQNMSSIFLICCNLFLTFQVLPMFVMSITSVVIVQQSEEEERRDWIVLEYILPVMGIFFCLTGVVSGWALYYLSITKREESLTSLNSSAPSQSQPASSSSCWRFPSFLSPAFKHNTFELVAKYRELLLNCFVVSFHLLIIGVFLRFHIPGECLKFNNGQTAGTSILSIWNCDPERDIPGVPNSATSMLLVAPFSICIALRIPRWWMCALCHTAILASYLGTLNSELPFDKGAMVISWWLAGLVFYYDLHKHYLISFFITNQFKLALEENAKYAEQIQANEMKHMIANVAHDLKTPLASFTSGLELISHILRDCHDCLEGNTPPDGTASLQHNKAIDVPFPSSSLLSINNCLHNLRSTNAFMIMAINRCIDYTKASKGMKLVPKYETIRLKETLELPLNCMKNIQDQCMIELAPISSEISGAVITDKQWLQENVLCLLSNAVKYSTAGKIVISVSLMKEKDSSNKKRGSFAFSYNKVNSERLLASSSEESDPEKLCSKDDDTSSIGRMKLPQHLKNQRLHTSGPATPIAPFSLNILANDEIHLAPPSPTLRKFPLNSNAASAAPDLTTKISHYLLIEIRDNGIGITDEVMATLFNPFKQAQRFTGGTGLGLFSLAKRVEALHGKYGVKKREDGEKGSLFWFAFPYRPDDTRYDSSSLHGTETVDDTTRQPYIKPPGPQNEASNELQVVKHIPPIIPIKITENLSKKIERRTEEKLDDPTCLSILIVDDSPSIIKMLTMLLKRQRHIIQTAQNGEIALKAIEDHWRESQEPFDVILMDLQMPVMDGLEATRRLRSMESEGREWMHRSHSHHVVIGMSANSDHDTMTEALKSGVDAFVGKPFSLELFNKTVRNLLLTKTTTTTTSGEMKSNESYK